MAKRKQNNRKRSVKNRPVSNTNKRKRARQRHFNLSLRLIGLLLLITGLGVFTSYALFLDFEIRKQFEGRRWALPARVFSRPLEIYAGKVLSPDDLIEELKLLRYRPRSRVDEPGEYQRKNSMVMIHTRGFPFWDGYEPQRTLHIVFREGKIVNVYDKSAQTELGLSRLEPVPIASIYPVDNEDRMLVRMGDVPPLLISALLTVEDRKFYDHQGLDPIALVRAMVANIKAGRAVQGGSTLTQQLVKNFFLSNKRTLWRKFNEAIMAWLLEWHYSKDEILEAYLNEIFLGQDKQRAIHGFGLASQFYFERRLSDLKPEQIALLVAMIKGPSFYDPRRHPQRARQRRNLVLDMLLKHGHLSSDQVKTAKSRALGVTRKTPSGMSPFPAFLRLVREQLKRDYQEEDLRAEGLVIFTTLDPIVQLKAERAMIRRLTRLENQRGVRQRKLQGAVVVNDIETSEILALIGDRNPRLAGYNRALDARRPIGSLIKPVVYLAALSQPQKYTLATRIDDTPFSLKMSDGKVWSPLNYDHETHGQVLLREALIQSYNVSTARLGLAVGLKEIAYTLRKLGLSRNVPRYPSMLLGAVELSPYEVSQIYQTLASGAEAGLRAPLRAIRQVMDHRGELLQRYTIRQVKHTVDPAASYLLTAALHEVTQQGTARSLKTLLPSGLKVAGKTGTSDEWRDSWFAGFSGEHLAVVWIGLDDNRSTGLTGTTGALTVWADIMGSIPTKALDRAQPANVEWVLIDPASGLRADEACQDAEWVPFIKNTAPTLSASCAQGMNTATNNILNWLRDF